LIEIFFLGTSSGIPSKNAPLPSIAIRTSKYNILLDCGEGTQERYIKAGLGVNRPLIVLISHMHGDHIYGLPGLLHTFSLLGRKKKIKIIGPRGLKDFILTTLHSGGQKLEYDLDIVELTQNEETVLLDNLTIIAKITPHSVENYAYKLQEKDKPGKVMMDKLRKLGVRSGPLIGKLKRGIPVKLPSGLILRPEEYLGPPIPGISIVYSGDTPPNPGLISLSKNVDVLIHESTFSSDLVRNAQISKHSTTIDAANVALLSNAKILILTHISPRYRDKLPLLEEARKIFPLTFIAKKGLRIKISKKSFYITYYFDLISL